MNVVSALISPRPIAMFLLLFNALVLLVLLGRLGQLVRVGFQVVRRYRSNSIKEVRRGGASEVHFFLGVYFVYHLRNGRLGVYVR